MPKGKKSNAISLVSAYESGAESDSQSEAESESEQVQSSPSSTNESQNSSRESTKSLSVENDELKRKRLRTESQDSNNLSQQEITIDYVDDEFSKKTNMENLNKVNDQETISKNIESVQINTEFFSEQNGFLPGCDKIKLPPAPDTLCSQSLQNKIVQVLARMKNYNYSINNDIKNKKTFKNPSIYEKLIDSYGIDEFGSSFETHIDDLKANGYMFYDELDQAQMAEWAKKDKEKKERTKIEMVSGTKKK